MPHMQELEAQQAELQTTENRYAEVKLWLDSFADTSRAAQSWTQMTA